MCTWPHERVFIDIQNVGILSEAQGAFNRHLSCACTAHALGIGVGRGGQWGQVPHKTLGGGHRPHRNRPTTCIIFMIDQAISSFSAQEFNTFHATNT